MWTRLRGIGLWLVTGFDDIVIERFWARLERGDVAGAFRVWSDLLFGWWGCAVVFLLLGALVVLGIAAVAS